MAPSRPNSLSKPVTLLAAAALVALAGLMPARATAAALGKCTETIEVEGDNLGANLRQSTTELKNVIISGCDTRIEAQRARVSRLDFEDSNWTFEGNVRIRMEQQHGSLRSDLAVVTFRDNQIARVTITGSPAEFEQKRSDSDAIARGRAGKMVYDFAAGTVRLSDDAWISDGSTEISNPQLEYDIRKQEVKATNKPGAGERVRLTITPKPKDPKPKVPTQAPPGAATDPAGADQPPAP
jgi:lipopolysaccharide transport protein LptA